MGYKSLNRNMFLVTIVIFFGITIEIHGLIEEFCQTDVCGNFKHVDCGFAKKTINYYGKYCSKCANARRLVNNVNATILDHHNTYRNEQSRYANAVKMATMRWNHTLARLAQYRARECRVAEGDECRNTREFRQVGQNVGSISYIGDYKNTSQIKNGIFELVKGWFIERKNCHSDLLAKYRLDEQSQTCLHFTTMMQEQITDMGCGVVEEREQQHNITLFVVCNYSYSNQIGKPVYRAHESHIVEFECERNYENYSYLCEEGTAYSVYNRK